MSYRAAIVLVQDDQIALIERHRQGEHYFAFPGGHVGEGESPEQAAIREAREELGLEVVIRRMIAQIWWQGQPQYYYLVEATGGSFGSGSGEELFHNRPEKGTYQPVWMRVDELLQNPVLPHQMAELVVRGVRSGWPEEPLVMGAPGGT